MRGVSFACYEFMVKLISCKSTFFVSAYMEKIKRSYIDPFIKRTYDNPLDKLLQIKKTFEKERKNAS